MHEAFGAVDRVEDPGAAARALLLAVFLADHPVVREPFVDPPAQQGLGFAVGLGDRGAVALLLGHHPGLKEGEGAAPGFPGDVDREVVDLFEREAGHQGIFPLAIAASTVSMVFSMRVRRADSCSWGESFCSLSSV